jgi:AbrB family looped-hinge helix DNA binding protein
METVRLSSKGQFVLPKAIRDLHHWGPGTELLVMDTEEGVVIKPLKPFAATTFESPELSTVYKGGPLSLEEMDRAVAVEAGNHR